RSRDRRAARPAERAGEESAAAVQASVVVTGRNRFLAISWLAVIDGGRMSRVLGVSVVVTTLLAARASVLHPRKRASPPGSPEVTKTPNSCSTWEPGSPRKVRLSRG